MFSKTEEKMGYACTTFFFINISKSSLAFFSSQSLTSHLNANGSILKFVQMYSWSLSASSFFVRFLEPNAKMFLILPSRTKPMPFSVVTKGSHAYATSPLNENDPIDQIFGIDFHLRGMWHM